MNFLGNAHFLPNYFNSISLSQPFNSGVWQRTSPGSREKERNISQIFSLAQNILKIQLRFLGFPSLPCPLDLLFLVLCHGALQERTIPSFLWKGKGRIPIPEKEIEKDFKCLEVPKTALSSSKAKLLQEPKRCIFVGSGEL